MGVEIAVVAGLGAAGLWQQHRQAEASERQQRRQNSLAAAAAALDNRDSYEQRLIQFQEYQADLDAQRTGLDETRLEMRSMARQAEADRLSREATYADRAAEFDRGITEARRGISDARNAISDTERDRAALAIQYGRDRRDMAREASADSAFQRVLMAATGATGTASSRALTDAKTKEYAVASGRVLQDFRLEDNVLRQRVRRTEVVIGDYRDDIGTLNSRRRADAIALERSNRIAATDVADAMNVRRASLAAEKKALKAAELRLKSAREQARESFKRSDPQGRYYEDIVAREAHEKTPSGRREKRRQAQLDAQRRADSEAANRAGGQFND